MGSSQKRREVPTLSVQQPAEEPPAANSEVPQPDSANPADLDAALTGMSVLLRVALRLMKSSGTGGRQLSGRHVNDAPFPGEWPRYSTAAVLADRHDRGAETARRTR